MVSDSLSDVFPNPYQSEHPSAEHLLIGWELLEKHRHIFGVGKEAEFDSNKFIIKNA
jgi:hypothetical protein